MSDPLAKLQRVCASQRNHIGMLERKLEELIATKADHIFRLRTILVAALQDAPGWQDRAHRELGTKKENPDA